MIASGRSRPIYSALRWLPILVLAGLASALLVYALSSGERPTYEATATVSVGQSLSGSISPDSERLVASYLERATMRALLARVLASVDVDRPLEGVERAVLAAPRAASMIDVTVRDHDPAVAATLANAIAQELVVEARGTTAAETAEALAADLVAIRSAIEATKTRISDVRSAPLLPGDEATLGDLEDRLALLAATSSDLWSALVASSSADVAVIDPAVGPFRPVEPRPLLYAQLAGAVGFLIAAACAYMYHTFSDRVRTSDDIERVTGWPFLGELLQPSEDQHRGGASQLVTLLHPMSTESDRYRALRTRVEFAVAESGLRSLLVTADRHGCETSVVAANLAAVHAQAGRRVLLFDANVIRPRVADLFGLPADRGWANLTGGDTAIESVVHRTQQIGLSVLPLGSVTRSPASVLDSGWMREFVRRLASDYELLVLDGPSIGETSEALVLSSYSQKTLVVTDASHASKWSLARAVEGLRDAGADVVGVAACRRTKSFLGSESSPTQTSAPRSAQHPARKSGRA